MTLLLESVYPALFVGILGMVVLGIAFAQTQRGSLLGYMAVVLLLAGAMLGLEWTVVTEAEEVEAAVDHLAAQLQANNVPGVLACLSPAADAELLRQQTSAGLARVEIQKAKLRDLSISVQTLAQTATAEFVGTLNFKLREGDYEGPYVRQFLLHYRRDEDQGPWLLHSVEQRDFTGQADATWKPLP